MRESIKAQLGDVRCRICKRVIEQKSGRGRVREIHTECGQYESALSRIERFFRVEVVWENEHALKVQRGDVMTVLNQQTDKRRARFARAMEATNE
jgi:hypothetical protein